MAYGRQGRRRAKSEINVVPYIDVMLVLLVIFMVTAPMVTPSSIDLPTIGRAQQQPEKPFEINIGANGDLSIRDRARNEATLRQVSKAELLTLIQTAQTANPNQPVVIGADKSIRYEEVIKVMGELQQQNIKRISLLVKQGA